MTFVSAKHVPTSFIIRSKAAHFSRCLAAYSGSDGIDITIENGKILPNS